MSNYRRLISYIYAYEGGIKGRNIGYAKIEVRSGQCRIHVSVKRIYVGSNDIGVYLLSPKEEILLGKIFIRGGSGEFRINVSENNIEGSGCSLEECYGLTIHDVENTWQCYTTIWEDAVAQAAEIDLADITAENIRNLGTQRRQKEMKGSEWPEQTKEEEYYGENMVSVEENGALAEKDENVVSSESPELAMPEPIAWEPEVPQTLIPQPETPESVLSEPITPESVMSEPTIPEFVMSEPAVPEPVIQESIIPELPLPESAASEPSVQESATLDQPMQREATPEPPTPEPLTPEPLTPREATPEPPTPKATMPEPENPAILEELDRQEQEASRSRSLWPWLQCRYAKVLAFDYDNGCEILSIKPQDIGLLPREIWTYGNNSFLLHGYYNYRHLILAKLNNPSGSPRYLLGVPGHYFSNEKYMASMFGFPHFVLAKKQPDADGRFGYWYTDIRLP